MAEHIDEAYRIARERYAELGVDTDAALKTLSTKTLSLPCWQGDDLGGFENRLGRASGGGMQTTGGYPGKARNPDELRQDLEKALSLIPGRHRVNLHSIYGEFADGPASPRQAARGDKRVDRHQFGPEHFTGWINWAKAKGIKLDFNATLFAHPKSQSGFTLSSKDHTIRRFWVDHVRCCREIASRMGRELGDACIHNLWIPDGMKDLCVDRAGYRKNLADALDEVYSTTYDPQTMKDSVESKLFGIGSETFVVGSFEFYLGYALTRKRNQGIGESGNPGTRTPGSRIPESLPMLCLDTGHFHPTESVADKISSLLTFMDELLLHISRGVRWDSDHVPVLDDSLREIALEIVRCNALARVHMALDFFDASINRVAAWTIGARATLKALLLALLEPRAKLMEYETTGDYTARLALLEEARSLPSGAVWDYHCLRDGVPVGADWLAAVLQYEQTVQGKRV